MPSLLQAWKRLFDRPATNTHAQAGDIRAWQKTVLEEHEGLRAELELLSRTYARTVDRFVERANELSDEEFLQEQASIESIRKILQNAIRRLEVSCKDHRELMDEWHEWVTFCRAAGQRHELEPAHKLRVEMIRSELTIRGIQVDEPNRKEQVQRIEEAATSTDQPLVQAVYLAPRATEPVLDDLVDWLEIRKAQIEPEWQAAEQAWSALAPEAHLYPEQAVAHLKRLREAHGELKLLDRARREERDRLVIFHPFS
jgi:hypothetical protein